MKTKSLIIAIIAVVVILMCSTEAFALSFSATMTPSNTTVPESTEFSVIIKVSNIDAGVNGINSLTGYLSYDTKVFDAISESSIDGLNGWTVNYAPDTGKVTLLKSSFVKSEEEVFQVTFRTKAGTSGQKGLISYKSIVASNSETDISAPDISTTIIINNTPGGNSVVNNGSKPVNVVPVPANNNTSRPTNITPTPISPVNNAPANTNPTPAPINNTAQEEVPYTGADDVVIRAIFVVLVVAAISYFKFQSLNDEK